VYDLIIIGAGPAGLTATAYALNKRLDFLLISEDLGGKAGSRMHLDGLEGYETINGEETVRKFLAQLAYVDVARATDRVDSVTCVAGPGGCERFEVVTGSGRTCAARAVIVATGARARLLGVPGERELLGRGVSYSAVSHAPLFWGRDTAVVGSGDLALRAVAELADIAARVYVVTPNALPAESPLATRIAARANVTVLPGHVLTGLSGDPYLSAMTLRSPTGSVDTVSVAGLFVELGIEANSELVAPMVDLTEGGQIRVDTRGATSRPGIFAAGDVTDAYSEQVLIAIGDGARAALAAHEYLLEHPRDAAEPLPVPPPPRPEQDW
jgi:thioredoxin reductase